MTCRGYICSKNTGNNLVEINEEMSELSDKQLWQPMNKVLTTKVGGNWKCEMKIKKKEKRLPVKKNFNDRNDFFRILNNRKVSDEDETNNNETT